MPTDELFTGLELPLLEELSLWRVRVGAPPGSIGGDDDEAGRAGSDASSGLVSARLPALRALRLSCDMSAAGVRRLFHEAPWARGLRRLKFMPSRRSVAGACAEVLAAPLVALTKLVFSGVYDAALVGHLAAAAAREGHYVVSLAALELQGPPERAGDDAAPWRALAAAPFRALRALNLEAFALPESALLALSRARWLRGLEKLVLTGVGNRLDPPPRAPEAFRAVASFEFDDGSLEAMLARLERHRWKEPASDLGSDDDGGGAS